MSSLGFINVSLSVVKWGNFVARLTSFSKPRACDSDLSRGERYNERLCERESHLGVVCFAKIRYGRSKLWEGT